MRTITEVQVLNVEVSSAGVVLTTAHHIDSAHHGTPGHIQVVELGAATGEVEEATIGHVDTVLYLQLLQVLTPPSNESQTSVSEATGARQ